MNWCFWEERRYLPGIEAGVLDLDPEEPVGDGAGRSADTEGWVADVGVARLATSLSSPADPSWNGRKNDTIRESQRIK